MVFGKLDGSYPPAHSSGESHYSTVYSIDIDTIYDMIHTYTILLDSNSSNGSPSSEASGSAIWENTKWSKIGRIPQTVMRTRYGRVVYTCITTHSESCDMDMRMASSTDAFLSTRACVSFFTDVGDVSAD